MATSSNIEADVLPSIVCAIVDHDIAIDIESALIPIIGVAAAFTPETAKEADGTFLSIVNSSADGRSGASYAAVTTLDAVSAVVTRVSIVDHGPRIGGVVGPASRNLTVFEVKDLIAVTLFRSNCNRF